MHLPAIEFDYEREGNERIEEIADQLREFWNVGFGPITDLAPLLEYHGVIVIEEPVRCEDMDAVSRWQGGRPYMLYAADQESNSRKLFNLAHELAHLVLHNGVEVNSRNLDRLENQADRIRRRLPPAAPHVRAGDREHHCRLPPIAQGPMARGGGGDDLSVQGTRDPEHGSGQVHVEADERPRHRMREPLDNAFALSKPTVLAPPCRC